MNRSGPRWPGDRQWGSAAFATLQHFVTILVVAPLGRLITTQQETLDGVKVVRARLRFRFGPPLGDIMAQVSELPGVVGVDLSPRAADDL